MSRRKSLFIIAIAAAVLLLVAVSLVALDTWDGGLEFADLEAGARKTMANGLTLTVPPGRSGYYNRWAYLPKWMPVSWAKTDTPIRETWQLLPRDGSKEQTDTVVAVTYHAGVRSPGIRKRRLIARFDGVDVYSSQEGAHALAVIEVRKPALPAVYMIARIDTTDPAGSLRRLWSTLRIQGAPSP